MNLVNSPLCEQRKITCCAFESGHCVILTNTHFEKKCPFFKTTQQVIAETRKKHK